MRSFCAWLGNAKDPYAVSLLLDDGVGPVVTTLTQGIMGPGSRRDDAVFFFRALGNSAELTVLIERPDRLTEAPAQHDRRPLGQERHFLLAVRRHLLQPMAVGSGTSKDCLDSSTI